MKHLSSTRRFIVATALAALSLVLTSRATPPPHNVAAGLIDVTMNDSGTGASSINVTLPFSINDLRLRSGSTVGSSRLQVGPNAGNGADGIVMSCPAENNKDYSGVIAGGGLSNVCSAAYVDGSSNLFVATFGVMGQNAGSNPRLNINTAAAYFPFSNWIAGWVKNSTNQNGGVMDTYLGNTNIIIGSDPTKGSYTDLSGGRHRIDLRNLGIDSRVSGVLLVTGQKNETANFGQTSTNSDGTWTIFIHDDGANSTNSEADPVGWVYVPKSNTNVISGRFDSKAGILMYSGNTPQFTVNTVSNGAWQLKPIGVSVTNSVLIISPEGSTNTGNANTDNYVSYVMNSAQDGWIIQTHDCPLGGVENISATEPICTFVVVPGGSPGFTATPTNNIFTTESGGTAQFSVVLDTQPTADVTISVASDNPQEGTTDVNQLTFTSSDWNTPHVVTVTGVDDAVSDGTVFYHINLGVASSADPGYNGLQPPTVTVGNIDNDPGITVTPISGIFTTEAGGTATFNVHLNTQPTDNVTISIQSSNPNEGTVDVSSLTFTTDNWNQDQTVTITGVDDFVQDGDQAYTIVTGTAQTTDPAYIGYNPPDVSVVNRDDDIAGIVASAAGPDGLTMVEGHGSNYTVRLSSQPTANVTVNIASSDTAQGGTVTPSSLVFTPANWSNAQPVSVTATDDLVLDGDTTWHITNSSSSSDPVYAAVAAVPVIVHTLDNEATIKLPSGPLIYGLGLNSVGIDGRATVSDPYNAGYSGATLRVTITNNATADDQLGVRNDGSGTGQIGVSGNSISYEGTQIASFSGASGSSPLTITFNAAATTASVEATLRNVTFATDIPGSTRNVLIALTHPDGGVGSATTSIRVGLLCYTEFQEGADHGYGAYTGENDIMLKQGNPNTPFPAGGTTGLFVDAPTIGGNASEVLLRFDNIFGSGPGQIPSNAVIVAADVTFHVLDSGDASPLYRMLYDWDATNSTWTSFSSGVGLTIGTDTQPNADSVWGLPDGSANTSTNSATVSVLPDINAWLHGGEENHGWALVGWDNRTDGTGFSPSEDPTVSWRPDLRVLWLPPTVSSNSFRQNVNGYTNAVDTQIRGDAVGITNSYATVATIGVDWNVSTPGDQSQVLIRFDNFIGSGPGQIPPGSQIHAAMLDLTSQSGSAQGHGGHFHRMLIPWNDTDLWTTFGNGITNDGVKAVVATSVAAGSSNLDFLVQGGYLEYEITADVAAWVNGTPNYGWVILPWVNGGDGWFFGTAENGTENYRPQLRVYYTPAAVQQQIKISSGGRTATTGFLNFTGAPNTTYSIVRATAVKGPYGSIGQATTDASGNGSFTDNAPPAGAAFYQISNP